MRWKTIEGYVIEEMVVTTNSGRPARVLSVTDGEGERSIGVYASWADLIAAVDVRQIDETV